MTWHTNECKLGKLFKRTLDFSLSSLQQCFDDCNSCPKTLPRWPASGWLRGPKCLQCNAIQTKCVMSSDCIWMIRQDHWGHPQLDVNHLAQHKETHLGALYALIDFLVRRNLRYLCKSHWSNPFLPRGGAAEWAQRGPIRSCGHSHLNSADITTHKFYLITLPFKISSLLRSIQTFTWGFTQESCSVSWKSWIIKMLSHTPLFFLVAPTWAVSYGSITQYVWQTNCGNCVHLV